MNTDISTLEEYIVLWVPTLCKNYYYYDSAKFIIIYLTIKQFVLFQISYPLTGYGSIYIKADVDNGCFVPFSFVKHFWMSLRRLFLRESRCKKLLTRLYNTQTMDGKRQKYIVRQPRNNSNHWLLAQICENAYTNIAHNVMKHSISIPWPILWKTTKHV